MAEQLLDNRTPRAYAGVEKFARQHTGQDAEALAWLVTGYAHLLDQQNSQAIYYLQKARPRAGVLGDYVDYFLSYAQAAQGDAKNQALALKDFDLHHPQSLFSRDAAINLARAYMQLQQPPAALEVLLAHRTPPRADVEVTLGRAQEQAGEVADAISTLRHVYYTMPLSAEAQSAALELKALSPRMAIAPPTLLERRTRADLLTQNHHSAEAVPEYRSMLNDAPAADVPSLKLSLANALWQSRNSSKARDLLQKMPDPGGELGAQRLYYLIELNRTDVKTTGELITHLRESAPTSPWLEEALLTVANQYLLRSDYATASQYFLELTNRFPEGKHAAYANWKAAWLQFRLGDVEGAKQAFERHLALFPVSVEASAAMYWRGRLAEDENSLPLARAYYAKASERFRNDYYADLSHDRLRALGLKGEVAQEPLLDRIPLARQPAKLSTDAPSDNLHLQKSLLLENCGMLDFAVRELQAAGAETNANWNVVQIAKLYSEDGFYNRAMQTLKHAVPGYYSLDINALPRPVWEQLFPRAYWDDLKHYSNVNQLDPFLVASIIRQESEFYAGAVSHARAMGLMQILPSTGRKLARSERIKGFNTNKLLDPPTNLQLGTRYLRGLLDEFDGNLEYALAAYNAGPERVDTWRTQHYRDIPEFVESIPFTETRDYVEAIERNHIMYRQLYKTP